MSEKFSLKWNDYNSNWTSSLSKLRGLGFQLTEFFSLPAAMSLTLFLRTVIKQIPFFISVG